MDGRNSSFLTYPLLLKKEILLNCEVLLDLLIKEKFDMSFLITSLL